MKGISQWIWIVGSIIAAIIIFTMVYNQILLSSRAIVEQESIKQFSEITSNANDLCWETAGNKREFTLNLGDMVEGIYAAESAHIEYEKEQMINKIILNNNSIGNYLCLKITDKRLECEEVGCNVSFPFIGYVPEKFSLTALIDSLKGKNKIYTYSLVLRRDPDSINVFLKGLEPTTTTSTTIVPISTTTLPQEKGDMLIVALKANLKKVYSDSQISTLENKIKDYITSLSNDNLNGIFLYLDEDETSNLIGSKVTSPTDWNNVDGILDQVVQKTNAKYVLIVGGYDRFPSPVVSGYKTDNPYADCTKDNIPDVALGRLPEPNGGDMDLFISAFDTFIRLHNSGGLDLSSHVGRTLGYDYLAMKCWSLSNWGKECKEYPNCKAPTSDSNTAASGKVFFYLVQHGSPGPPQHYISALTPSDLSGMDVSDAVWMIVPCHGGVINYQSTSQGIVLTFFKNGGAIHMSSTNYNCCATPAGACDNTIDGGGVAALYDRIAKNFVVGTRIGDAYKNGKIKFKSEMGNGQMQEFYINCLYGDPSLKIKSMW